LIGWGRSDPARNYQIDDYLTTITEFLEQTCSGGDGDFFLTAAFTIRVRRPPHLFKSLVLTTPAGLSDFGENYSRSFFAQLVRTRFSTDCSSTGVATSNGRTFLEQRQFARSSRVYQGGDAYLESAQQPNAEYAALLCAACADLSLHC